MTYELIDPNGDDIPANRRYREQPKNPAADAPAVVRVQLARPFVDGFLVTLGAVVAGLAAGAVVWAVLRAAGVELPR